MSNTTLPDDALYLIKRRDELAEIIYRQRNSSLVNCLMPQFDANGYERTLPVPRVLTRTASPGIITQEKAMVMTANVLWKAQITCWRPDILQAAMDIGKQFDGVKLPASLVPQSDQWWPMALLKSLPLFSRVREVAGVEGFLVGSGAPSYGKMSELLIVCILGKDSKNTPQVLQFTHKVGRPLSWKDNSLLVCIVSALDFMAQDFTEQTTHRAPARQGLNKQKYVPVVRTVQLRARPKAQAPTGDATGTTSREYEHSWMVAGHRRRLAQPRKADGAQVVWVRPHVKGDPAKPLLPPRETIIKVAR